MTNFCNVAAGIRVDGQLVKSKSWPACDVMKTGVTRAWATRQFNLFLRDLASCDLGRDRIVRADWIAKYGEAQGNMSVSGWLSGVNGRVMAKRGVFED